MTDVYELSKQFKVFKDGEGVFLFTEDMEQYYFPEEYEFILITLINDGKLNLSDYNCPKHTTFLDDLMQLNILRRKRFRCQRNEINIDHVILDCPFTENNLRRLLKYVFFASTYRINIEVLKPDHNDIHVISDISENKCRPSIHIVDPIDVLDYKETINDNNDISSISYSASNRSGVLEKIDKMSSISPTIIKIINYDGDVEDVIDVISNHVSIAFRLNKLTLTNFRTSLLHANIFVGKCSNLKLSFSLKHLHIASHLYSGCPAGNKKLYFREFDNNVAVRPCEQIKENEVLLNQNALNIDGFMKVLRAFSDSKPVIRKCNYCILNKLCRDCAIADCSLNIDLVREALELCQ